MKNLNLMDIFALPAELRFAIFSKLLKPTYIFDGELCENLIMENNDDIFSIYKSMNLEIPNNSSEAKFQKDQFLKKND